MLQKALNAVFGSRNDRVIKQSLAIVEAVNALEPEFDGLSDAALREKTVEFRQRVADGESLDRLLPEAFAACREAAKRALGMRHYDTQIIGGWCLHKGWIAEMVTGEGKTLVATLAVYLNTLANRGVHLVTVNDYLARRDALWVGPVYEALGLTVGCIQSAMHSEERIPLYACDVTYGTNSEFGFDYLRDNMKATRGLQCQRGLAYAVIDEVDSILIDEARTPLIISGPADDDRGRYEEADKVARQLKRDVDFEVKEKEHQCVLSDDGLEKAEELAGVDFFAAGNTDWMHLLEQSLRAHCIYKRDKDYVVKDGEIIIVDEFTGRLMEGRRWSDGLHQAVEAKERLKPRPENQTLATITYQNYFKLYDKIAGMTGTALTEAGEFWQIYKLDVVAIPTNRPLIRAEYDDEIYANEPDKFRAVVEEIVRVQASGRPILVGTTSIEKSERLSGMLERRGVEHVVLNAKYHERESTIVARAGQAGTVTIATNMAGRGTDIVLGAGVTAAGGLHIIGTERHESRRVDNQLRGRSGRQGDPGSSQFFLSLEDDLMRIFAPEWVTKFLTRMGLKDGEAITHPMVTKAITRAQKKVESRNFEIRKNLLDYDEVMDVQRKEVYGLRDRLLLNDDEYLVEVYDSFIERVVEKQVGEFFATPLAPDERDPEELARRFRRHFGIECKIEDVDLGDEGNTTERLVGIARDAWKRRIQEVGAEDMRRLERFLLLDAIDTRWKDHLHAMDGLKTGIGLRGYGQQDPKIMYKIEGHRMFQEMLDGIRELVTEQFLKVRFSAEAEQQLGSVWEGASEVAPPELSTGVGGHAQAGVTDGVPIGSTPQAKPQPIVRDDPKVGRNDPCPCGSGQKYKKCHGAPG
ncbi:MAG: preprotein translocase subunit SecA [Planctomycetota bacterium]|nr:preprotein translocase subunit SecA [Planctomycetota bacterium]